MTQHSQSFAIQDARCAGCLLKIERKLADLPGVLTARTNATQKRLLLSWDETQQTAQSLIDEIGVLGYRAVEISTVSEKERSLLPQIALAGLGTMNTMAFSVSVWAGLVTDMGPDTILLMHWLSAVIATPVVIYSGAVFYGPALRALRARQLTMDTPISLAIWVTFIASLFELWRGASHVYFDAAVSLIFFLLIGRFMDQSLRRLSGDAADNLREMTRMTARLLTADGESEMLAEALTLGDEVMILTGERVPADGKLLTAIAECDESLFTGETVPRIVKKGQQLLAGSLLVAGPARMQVTQVVGAEAQISQMADLVAASSAHKGQMQAMADRFASGYVPLVLLSGLFGFCFWLFFLGAEFGDALMIAVAVLVVTCPCAAGLATPAVAARAVNLALRSGVIVKSGVALERLGEVDKIYLDKTGTASNPIPVVEEDLPQDVATDIRSLAAASRHPLAQAISNQGQAGLDATEHVGQGVEARDGARLGSAGFVGAELAEAEQPTIWYRSSKGEVTPIPFRETANPSLESFLKDANSLGLPICLLSGDSEIPVRRFAETHGIACWHAKLSPQAKLNLITERQRSGRGVFMIGDGINDCAALAGAAVSGSFAGASHVAQVAADIVLLRPDLTAFTDAVALARNARRLIWQNLTFSTIYNVVTIPLALAGWLTPLLAAVFMSSSSLFVMLNALRLKAKQ